MRYRSIVREDNEGQFVILQFKENIFSSWKYFAEADNLAEADKIIKGISTGVITTGIWDYDKAGNRIYTEWF